MGIRFYCPNGHKLNVKEFQAGQKGICPFCGVKILIPNESTRPKSKFSRRKHAASTESGQQTSEPIPMVVDDTPMSPYRRVRRHRRRPLPASFLPVLACRLWA